MLITTKLNNQTLLQNAKRLPAHGIIATKEYYSFLKIRDEYIHELYDLLDKQFNTQKPNYFSPPKAIGAHITIAYPEESTILHANDIGQEHIFTVKDFCHVTLDTKKYLVLLISAPSLTQLRKKYHLPEKPRYKGHSIDFHITIANVI